MKTEPNSVGRANAHDCRASCGAGGAPAVGAAHLYRSAKKHMSAEEYEEVNPRAKAALLQGLEQQLSSPDTPEVKAELDRLLSLGVKKKEAKKMIAAILAVHIVHMMKQQRPFDYAAYLAELRRLPEIDYDQPL